MITVKFGGTSVGNVDAARKLIEIVRSRLDRQPVVVVSALSKVTDLLYKIAGVTPSDTTLEENIAALKERHFSHLKALLGDNPKLCIATQKKLVSIITEVAQTAEKGILSDRDKAAVISSGELMSSVIICAALNNSGIATSWVDARKMMITTGDPLKSEPDMDEICERTPQVIAEAFAHCPDAGNAPAQAVITQGFICSSASGKAAVLGRGGSDYSASIFGMALDADAIEIWTDVDGVRTADPRRVPTTRCLKRISYEEAAEMAHFGAKVLHPLTLEPAMKKDIPVYVLNTNNPDGENTEILRRDGEDESVKSVSYKENILVITMFSKHPIDASGFLKKIFDVFSECKVGVDLISTNNAQISVTMDSAQKNLNQAIGRIQEFADVVLDYDKAQISAIGSSASGMNGILRMTFAPLRDCKIYMVSPGASFVNISFVVDKSRLDDILCQTHKYLIENEGSY